MASLLGRMVCSFRAGSAPVFGAAAVVRRLCSAATLKGVPVLSPSVSLQCSSCLIPRLSSSLPAAPNRYLVHSWRCSSTNAGTLEQVNAEIETQSPSKVFAVVHISGRQFKITSNDLIVINRIAADIGEQIFLEKVLLAGSDNFTLVGTPVLSKDLVRVKATVTEHSRAAKVIVFKKKRRKNYKRKKGHRQDITVLRINNIELSPNLK